MTLRIVLPALALAGCTAGSAQQLNVSPSFERVERVERRSEAVLIDSVLTSAARQVQRCYRTPRVASSGRQIITQLRIRVFPGGDVRGLPVVLNQSGVTPANQPYAQPMAEAAVEAVMRCAPLTLPDRVYRYGWVDIFLTFSPLARA